jgi:PPOX class probable F420-dependent enzyme
VSDAQTPAALSPAEAAFVTERRLARVATVGLDGVPHLVPVLYAFHEGAFWFSSDPGALKARQLAHHPVAALVVDEPPPVKAGVTVSGDVDIFTDGPMFERAQDILQAAGAGARRRMAAGEQAYFRLVPRRVASWKVEPKAST